MAMKNLTGVPAIWGELGLPGAGNVQPNDADEAARKKKLLGAGTSQEFQNATKFLFGDRFAKTGGFGA